MEAIFKQKFCHVFFLYIYSMLKELKKSFNKKTGLWESIVTVAWFAMESHITYWTVMDDVDTRPLMFNIFAKRNMRKQEVKGHLPSL